MTTLTSRPLAGREESAPPGWGPLLVVLTGTFMTFLDFFIVNVALPSTQADLGAGRAAVQLVVAGYGLCSPAWCSPRSARASSPRCSARPS